MAWETIDDGVYRFLLDQIDTIPQMEALLLLWESRPAEWTEQALAQRLYLGTEAVTMTMRPLAQRRLILVRSADVAAYRLESISPEMDRLIEAVAIAYRRDLVRVTSIIHSKASSGVLEFARAFKFKKGNE